MLEDIPRKIQDAVKYFAVPAHCNDFMREIKWPGGASDQTLIYFKTTRSEAESLIQQWNDGVRWI